MSKCGTRLVNIPLTLVKAYVAAPFITLLVGVPKQLLRAQELPLLLQSLAQPPASLKINCAPIQESCSRAAV